MLWREVVHHPSHYHVYVCIRPERCHHEQREPRTVLIGICRVIDRKDAENETGGLPGARHNDDNAVEFPCVYCLDEMGTCRDAEKYGECIGGGDRRTKLPDGLGVTES